MQFTILTLIAYFPKDAEVANIATWIVRLNRSSATVTVGKLWRYSLILLLLEAADIFFIYALFFYLFFHAYLVFIYIMSYWMHYYNNGFILILK